MKTIQWRLVGQASQHFLMAIGIVALVSCLATAPHWLAFVASLWLCALWFGFYRIARYRQSFVKVPSAVRKGKVPVRATYERPSPEPKKYYLYTDENRNPVYGTQ